MKFTILIIDDEKNIREGLGAAFEMEGYEVRLAANGKEGLDLIAKGDIDLVITDLRMDGISGEEVLRRVTTKTPGIPVIVLTGHGSIGLCIIRKHYISLAQLHTLVNYAYSHGNIDLTSYSG